MLPGPVTLVTLPHKIPSGIVTIGSSGTIMLGGGRGFIPIGWIMSEYNISQLYYRNLGIFSMTNADLSIYQNMTVS